MKKLLAILLFLATPAFAANPPIDVTVAPYNAVPDAVEVDGASASGTGASAPTANWAVGDVGKSIKIVDGYSNTAVFRGTIAARVSATSIALSGTATASCTSTCTIYYGTDNAAALNAAFAAASAMVTTPLNKTRVWGPSNTLGGAYMFNSALTATNVSLDFEAILYSNVGIGTGDTTIPLDCDACDLNVAMDLAGGNGPRVGNTGAHRIRIPFLRIKNAGFATGQKGMTCRGHGFYVSFISTDKGDIGQDWSGCQDIYAAGGSMVATGSDRSFVFSNTENAQLNLVCDSPHDSCYEIDDTRGVTVNAQCFTNGSPSNCIGKVGANSTNLNHALTINYLAQAAGGAGHGPALSVDYVDGGFKGDITVTNKKMTSGVGDDFGYCIQYGSHLSGTVDVSCTHDSAISLFTGTLYGNILDHSGDDYVYSEILVASKINLTAAASTNVVSVNLKGGNWLCYGNLHREITGTMVWGVLALNTVSATLPTAPNQGGYAVTLMSFTGAYPSQFIQRRYTMASGGGTVYLVVNDNFSSGTDNVYGAVACQRVQ